MQLQSVALDLRATEPSPVASATLFKIGYPERGAGRRAVEGFLDQFGSRLLVRLFERSFDPGVAAAQDQEFESG
jgi:hypothetical protein